MTALEAIRASVKHWEVDILAPLEAGRTAHGIDSTVYWDDNGDFLPIGTYSCALCVLYRINCCKCPLDIAGFGCHDRGSPYNNFRQRPSAETARAMIAALKQCEKIELENFEKGD